ncbi:hypothetical protein SAMN04488072_102174 [Lentibacillus halodurans]|uniref:Helix-turn-helix domain-containing protein n=1 Tax=Lentibacillus halodurans TaxID=237679 RepID=A0A1I0W4B8_9BACI|nr:hypothetical protein [Lentibacillus halodurans]SFA83070.1 hypothetical protein SAMN04488072_102174 [Lentibacillus halodurans]
MPINTSNHTFIVERSIFSNTFPELKEDRLRVYLLMCRVVGAKKDGICFMSIKTISNEVNLTEHRTRKAIEWLCEKHFIKKVRRWKQSNVYVVLVTPDYDPVKKQYYSNEDIDRGRLSMKDTLNGYVELPVEVMAGSILRDKTLWTDRKIRIFGQLYLYHWIDEFGGVDPKVVQVKKNTMYISELFSYTIGCSSQDIISVIRWLIREGFASKAKTVYRQNPNSIFKEIQYIGDAVKTNKLPSDTLIDVIRMNCIPSLKLKNAIDRTGGRIA